MEVAAPSGERLLLDAGRPLDAPREATGLLPATVDTSRPANVIFSHPHMDHWGLIDELPGEWPIWSGEKSAELMRLTTELFGGRIDRDIRTWHSRSAPFAIGGFTITPFLTDHSAFDAYMLLIEGWGRKLLYTGDFRTHGRKAVLVERMMERPPQGIDALMMEGTNLRSGKPVITEKELEDQFVELARDTPGHVFVQWSAQNIDRTVTLYRAAKRSGRTLVVDLYGADVLERVADGTGIPRPGKEFDLLQVVITPCGKRMYERQGREDFVTRMATGGAGTSRRKLSDGRAIIMLRDSMVADFAKDGLGFSADDAYAFSNWSGYLDTADPRSGWAQAERAGARTVRLHTSGHASPEALAAFAAAMAPKTVLPVHGTAWDDPGIPLPPVTRLADGEAWTIP
ncbi:MBL fold metallo-hydrolase [Sphingobium sp. S6]|uniref:MBL fold metallo-hydrolase n=1 Tax=Sphingobium sp. S6 TaxID=2758386 RepID=UPI001F1E8259|nr:MBL fold metallo-hydrolase [Sphingobium sp. S6]